MQEKEKRVIDSYTQQVQILNQSDMNGSGRLFGGRLMQWIDIVAGVVARRHSGFNVTTACVETLEFKKPAFAGQTLAINGFMTCVGNTSMEVCVETYVEDLDGTRELINRAYLTMVAIAEDGKPARVPRLMISNETEQKELDMAQLRKARRSNS